MSHRQDQMIVRLDKMKQIRGQAAATALATVLAALTAAGCSSSNETVMAPSVNSEPVYSVQPGEYRMAPGDEVAVTFKFHGDLNAEATVLREGDITVAGLGEFYAAGMTTSELEESIYRRASLTYRNPEVSAVVTKREAYRAYVGGEVRRPGYVAVRPGLTSMRAIFDRGGFLDTAKIDNVLYVHWADSGAYEARVVNLKGSLETGDVRNDVTLGPNDVVFVPKTPIANANLWVSQYLLKLIPIRPPTTKLEDFGGSSN